MASGTKCAVWGAVIVRLVAAALLVFGPWTNEPSELDGWDVARFQEIHDAPGRHWVDADVEYPPGSVVLIELLAADDVVGTHRRLVAASLVVDLAIAAVLFRSRRPRAGAAFLLLGLPLVPAGLLRFDLWAAAATAIALLLLDTRRHRTRTAVLFAAVVTAGAAVKLAPALVGLAALALGLRRHLVFTVAAGLGALAAWLSYGGVDALDQVLSLRGASGWHVESLPGSVSVLLGAGDVRFEADAFRVGTINDTVVLAGRLVLVAVAAALTICGARAHRRGADPLDTAALVVLGTTAALLVTAPLLSPQFLLWLTPPAALVWTTARKPAISTAIAIAITAGTLAVFTPPGVDHPVAAVLLLVRDAALIATVVFSGQSLGEPNLAPTPRRDPADDRTVQA